MLREKNYSLKNRQKIGFSFVLYFSGRQRQNLRVD